MKLRISDRILVALAGLILLGGCVGVIAQAFFQVDLLGSASQLLANQSFLARLALIVGLLLLLALGVYCVLVLFRHRGRKDRYVQQKNENGGLSISVKALESMVAKCLEPHPEIQVDGMDIENQKDGLVIRLNGNVAGGISIPLTVEALQREIKTYVTNCSGVEIKSILVEIQSSGDALPNAAFAISAPAAKPLLREENTREEELPAEEAIPEASASQTSAPEEVPERAPEKASPAPAPVVIEEDEDDRPLHQRLFKSKPEPCIIPEPPVEPAVSPDEGKAADAVTETEAGNEDVEVSADIAELKDEKSDAGADVSGETKDSSGADAPEEEGDPEARKAFQASQNAFDRIVTGQAEEEKKNENI